MLSLLKAFSIFDINNLSRMPKISKALRAIGLLLRNPRLLNLILEEDQHWRRIVTKRYNLPLGLPVKRAEDLFGDFHEVVEPFAILDGGSLPTDLALLKKLARRMPQCSYFEIGTWRGESIANVAEAAKECYTLNLSSQELKEKGFDKNYISQTGFYSSGLPNVKHLEGNSLTFDFGSLEKKFDLVFIDGDHHYDLVKNDTEKVFNHLVHDKSIVVWHDYACNPEKVRFEVLAGILDGSPEEVHNQLFHVAHTLCAVYLPGHSGGTALKTTETPLGSFRIDLDFKKTT
jgi:predicted O-methyltransferase YrrM